MTANLQISRLTWVLPIAALVTVGLFLMMRELIEIGPVQPTVVAEPPAIVINFDPIEVEPTHDQDMVLVAPIAPPTDLPPVRSNTDTTDPTGILIGPGVPTVAPSDIGGTGGPIVMRRDPMPIMRIQPIYPIRAAERRLEGQCTMQFDITPQGSTTNVRALDCSSSLFESASITAVSRWRYDPLISEGQPSLYRGATTQLVFRLDE